MNILTASKISRSFGEKTILRDASLYLEEGEKVGIIGINGKLHAAENDRRTGGVRQWNDHQSLASGDQFFAAASFISGRTDCYRGSLAEMPGEQQIRAYRPGAGDRGKADADKAWCNRFHGKVWDPFRRTA